MRPNNAARAGAAISNLRDGNIGGFFLRALFTMALLQVIFGTRRCSKSSPWRNRMTIKARTVKVLLAGCIAISLLSVAPWFSESSSAQPHALGGKWIVTDAAIVRAPARAVPSEGGTFPGATLLTMKAFANAPRLSGPPIAQVGNPQAPSFGTETIIANGEVFAPTDF